MEDIKHKVCSKCGEEKELSSEYWHRRKSSKDGYKGQCKECVKEYGKQYRKDNAEEIAEYKKQYRKDNEKYFSEYMKQYRADNAEEIAEYSKQYDKQYRADNAEELAEYRKKYYQSEQGRKSIARANQLRRARINSLPDTLTTEEYEDNLDHFDYKCAYCECELTPDNHHMEHVYPISKGKYGTTKENCIPSCDSCNSSKHAKTLAEWYVWTEDYSFERLLKIHKITSGGKEWIIN